MFSFLKKNGCVNVSAPVNGVVKEIETVNDPVFAQKMMGDGLAIEYSDGDVYAPVSGIVSSIILPSCHAFGIHSDEGLDVLVHVGLETVNLKGEGFKLLKQQGDRVLAGERVIEVDYNLLKNKNIDLITPIVITNSNEFKILSKAQGTVRAKDNILKLKKV